MSNIHTTVQVSGFGYSVLRGASWALPILLRPSPLGTSASLATTSRRDHPGDGAIVPGIERPCARHRMGAKGQLALALHRREEAQRLQT